MPPRANLARTGNAPCRHQGGFDEPTRRNETAPSSSPDPAQSVPQQSRVIAIDEPGRTCGPWTVLNLLPCACLECLGHPARIDSRALIPLFRVRPCSVNEKKPFGRIASENFSRGANFATIGHQRKAPRHCCRGALNGSVVPLSRAGRSVRRSDFPARCSLLSAGSAYCRSAVPSHARPSPRCARSRTAA